MTDIDAVDEALQEERRRHEYRLSFPGGEERTVLAFNPTEAILLASHGQPDQITDMTVSKEHLS